MPLNDRRVNEKTLELNVGAEVLEYLRSHTGWQRAYLRGLTQSEEREFGIDFFGRLPSGAQISLFQFKAPAAASRPPAYVFSIVREQHNALYSLASAHPGAVFYTFPYYKQYPQFHAALPQLLTNTWFLDANLISPAVFRGHNSLAVRCTGGVAAVNPEFRMQRLEGLSQELRGVKADAFSKWYAQFRKMADGGRRSSWLARGLRAFVNHA